MTSECRDTFDDAIRTRPYEVNAAIDTLSDTVQRGYARFPADGIPMRPQKVEYRTAAHGRP